MKQLIATWCKQRPRSDDQEPQLPMRKPPFAEDLRRETFTNGRTSAASRLVRSATTLTRDERPFRNQPDARAAAL